PPFLPAPTPRRTPFPYTTLFRSACACTAAATCAAAALRARRQQKCRRYGGADGFQAHMRSSIGWTTDYGRTEEANAVPGHLRSTDRKSTRLNSSHVAISYAVFCL